MIRLVSLIALLWTAPVAAQPVVYLLDAARTQVRYEVDFDKDTIHGTIPVAGSEFLIDLQGGLSTVHVTLNAAGADASFPFAEQALKGPKVLATGQYPLMDFASDQVRASATAHEVAGLVTIRGVTLPVTLNAQVFRQESTTEGDLSKVSVHLTGAVSRAAFGASGWSDMVGDEVRIFIVARLDRAE